MPKRKQGEVDNEGVQDFELIELLIRERETAPSTSTQQGNDFESFKARFQSYIDQIPSYLHSVGKEGFFPHFFLGSFSTLIDTEIAKKLDIEKIYFRFDDSKTLKVTVTKKGEIKSSQDAIDKVNLFVIADSGSKNKEFSHGELEEILSQMNAPGKTQYISNAKSELEVKLVEISKNADNKMTVEIKNTKLDKNDKRLQFTEIKKGKWNKPENDIAKLTNSDKKEVEKSLDKVLKKVSKIHSEYKGSLIYADKAREAAHHGFMAGALVNFRYRHNLRVYLEQFAGRGYADIILVPRGKDRSLNAIPIIIELKAATKEELKELEKGGKIKDGSQTTPAVALKQAEDYTKGFQPNVMRVLTTANDILCVGVNLDYPSAISDIATKSRDQEITPLFNNILESIDKQNNGEITQEQLKTQIQENIERIYHTFPGTGEKGDSHYFSRFLSGQSILLDKALEVQFKKYIFIPNVVTYAKFCNLLLDACDQISKPEISKIVRNLVKEVESVDLGLVDPEIVNIVRKIKEENGKNVETIKNIIKKDIVEKDGVKEKIKEVLKNENIPTEALRPSKQPPRTAAPKKEIDPDPSYAVVTMVFIPEEGSKKLTYVMNIVEADGRAEVINKGIPLDKLKQEIGNRKIVELNLNFNIKKQKSDFKEYFSMEVGEPISLEQYSNKKTDKFKGNFENIPYPDELKRTFDKALGSQRPSAPGQTLSIDKYNELLKTIGKGTFPLKPLIEKEAHFQAVLHGAFSYYSDIKLGESQENRALVLTEFQTGRGKRIDMVVHGIKFADQASSAKEYDPIGLELKGPREGKTADALKKEANEQITDEYKKGVTYKTLTDGTEVAFMGVVFDKGANNADSLILMSKDEFASVKVVHSSIFSISQQQCSKGRKQRSTGMACIDSRDEEKITEEEKEQRIKELFNADKVAERVKNIEFYDQLFKVSQKISKGETIDKNVEEAFVARIKDIDLDSIDPEIRDIVKEMKDNIENKEEVKNILRRSGVAEKIGKVAEGAGLAFTVFLVGKHIANGDIDGLGYDALNLWVMPKIGEKISGKMLELGTKLDSQMLKEFAPVMGRAIGNFAAFLGLAESIKARQNATDPADIKIADLNIATNSIFIAADVPAVVTETMSAIGMEAGIIGEFAGPVGAAISVAVIIIAQFVEAGLEVEKLEEHIKLTDQEKHDLYWDFFLGKKIPDYIENDLQAKEIYKQYISRILDKFDKDNYTQVVMSLPSILIKKEEYATNSYSRSKRQWEGIGIGMFKVKSLCNRKMRIISTEFNFEQEVRAIYPFYNVEIARNFDRVVPSTIGSYNLVCGPQGDNVTKQVVSTQELAKLPTNCDPYDDKSRGNQGAILKKIVERWFIQEHTTDCHNAVSYNKNNPTGPVKMLFYMSNNNAFINVTSNYTIDVIFNGKNILLNSYGIDNHWSSAQNRYYFTDQLSNCDIHKQGTNFFYIAKDNFVCNLGGSSTGQNNIVVTRGNFADSENIHSVIGSSKANHIEVSHAGYVDSKGGNDVITVKNFTTIKGYFGDSIYGKGLVSLPINFSNIDKVTYSNNRINIYNKSGAFISVDKQTSVKTADGLFVTPTKVDDKTGVVTNLHVTKSISGDVVLDDELDNLRKIDNSSFNITKQLSSANYHSTIGGSSNHIFYPDKEHHNFYWEAPSNTNHLYLFDNRNANITIAQANGILDFSQLNCTLDDIPFIENNKGEIKINKNGLNVILLPDYKDVTVTFDGQEYYKLQNGELERDYCSHSLRIDGRFSVNGTDLLNHHNCFTFDSDKVLFLKLNNDLLLLSDRGALSISNYYSSVHKNWDLSVGLNNRVMEPEEFRERADEFSSFRYYQPDEQGLQIYHNQPINKNDIGLIDLKGKSILDFDMKVTNDTLLLSHKNNTLVKVENWSTYQPAKEMMFGFNDAIVSNSKCIVSTCNSENVVIYFNKEKLVLSTEQLFDAVKQNNLGKVRNLLSIGIDINIRDRRGWAPLHYASDNDNKLDTSRAILNLNANIEAKTNIGETPLHIANAYGQLKIIELFIDKRANIEAKTNDGLTPLYVAIQHNNTTPKIIEFLIDKGVNIEAKTKDDQTPLHYAVFKDRLDIVRVLSSRGANIEAKTKDGKTPLDLAIQGNYTDIVGFLKQTQLDKKLLTAIENGDLPEVRKFVSQGANVNAIEVGIFGRKPIHIAAEKNYKDIIEFLLGKGVSVDDTSNYGWTPLHYTASKDCLEVAKFLVDKGANINAQNVYGREPIHIAAEHDNKNIIELLLNKGVSVNEVDKDGWMPLHWASWNGHLDAVEYLVGKGANINAADNSGKKPVHVAAESNNKNIIEFLLSKGVSVDEVDKDGWTPLHWAALKGHLEVAKFLVDKGAGVNAEDIYGKKPIHRSATVGHENIIELLLSKGVSVDEIDNGWTRTPLHWASDGGYLDVVKYLVGKGANINEADKNGETPLHLASWSGHLDVLEYLISNGANIGIKDSGNKTPLDIARNKEHNNLVKYLEQRQSVLDRQLLTAVQNSDFSKVRGLTAQGANIDTNDKNGNTPLYSAAEIGDLNLVKLLLDNGANIEAKNGKYQATPLHGAVENYKIDVVKLLLNRDANVNAEDKDNWTPLHYAADSIDLNIVELLVDAGANLGAKSNHGITPLDFAKNKGCSNIVKYLEGKLKEEREKPAQRKRRHHHEDHVRHHLSRKPLAIDSSGQPEVSANSGTRPSSWINDLFSWVKSSVGGLFYSGAALPEETLNTTSSISQIDAPMDVNGTIMLLDVLVRKVTGQKYISIVDQSISPLEARGYALNIIEKFEKVLNETAIKSGISVTNLNFDPVAVQSAIVGQIISEKFSKIPKTLYSFAKEACPEFQQTDKFLAHLRSNLESEKEAILLQQKVEKPSKILDQQVSGKVELSKKPDTFLNGASVVKGISNVLEL